MNGKQKTLEQVVLEFVYEPNKKQNNAKEFTKDKCAFGLLSFNKKHIQCVRLPNKELGGFKFCELHDNRIKRRLNNLKIEY